MKYVVYIHGATRHPAGYSKPWEESLRPYLGGADVKFVELNYSDIMTPWMPEWLVKKTDDWQRKLHGWGPWVKPYSPGILDDLLKWPSKRKQVIERIMEGLWPLILNEPKEITIICHSFGTIVVPEVLWSLEGGFLPGLIDSPIPSFKNLIMWGGAPDLEPVVKQWEAGKPVYWPLTGGPVSWKVHRPTTVDRIYNLSCYGDFAGGPIDPAIWLLAPGDVDMARRVPLVGPRDIPAAHADGFNPANEFAQKLMAMIIQREPK